jgi:hypothetical protein
MFSERRSSHALLIAADGISAPDVMTIMIQCRHVDSKTRNRERYQIIFKTITNDNFRFNYVSSKLDQVLFLLLLTNKLLLLK